MPLTSFNTMDIEQITLAFNKYVGITKTPEVFPEIRSNDFEFTEVTKEKC